jgi:putative aldouronate transport system substrate-binding protein
MKKLCLFLTVFLVFSLVSFAAPRTLRLEIFDRGNVAPGVLDNGPPAKWIQQAFGDPNNIKIEWVLVPRAQEVQKLQIMMAAGDAPDLCFTYDAVIVGSYVAQGGLADLTNVMKQYGQTLSTYLGKDVLDYGTWDGKILSIPGKRQMLGISGTWIRKDWLDKLGLPLPKTTQEYLTAVRAFRDKDPGKVGANLVPIGGIARDINLEYSMYQPSTERDRASWIGPSSTRPGRDLAIPGARDYFNMVNQMNSEGLYQKDWALWPKNDNLNFQSALSNGYVGAFTDNWAYLQAYNIIPALKKNAPQAVYVPIDPFVNSQGKTAKYVYNPIGIFNLVPVFSKNADLVIQYLNWMSDVKNMTKIMFGDAGAHYDLDKEGIIIPRKLTGDAVWEAGNVFDRVIILNGRPYDSVEKAIRMQIASFIDDTYPAATFLQHWKYIEKDGIPPVRIANPPDSLSKLGPMLLDKAEELAIKIAVAKRSEFNAVFEKSLKEWLDLGAGQVKADMLKQYDIEHKK